jgi:hypothetical protein
MNNSTANLIVKLYNSYTVDYRNSINNLDLNRAKLVLHRMNLLDGVMIKYQ